MLIRTVMNERGEITTSKLVVTVVIIFMIAYFSIKLVPMYFKYEMMQLEVKSALDNAHQNSIARIRGNLMSKINDMGLDIDGEQLIVEKEDRLVRIILWWDVDKVFFGFWEKNFYYDIEDVREL